MQKPCIALLSDFGLSDVYVGVMKAVLMRIAPRAILIDLTHDIPPGDVRRGAFRLWQALPALPPGTIFLAVVDPGVGTNRLPVAVACGDFSCVGPDNGLFTYLLKGRKDFRAVEIISAVGIVPGRKSSTFHGRDIFAPAAGMLASGRKLEDLGPVVRDLAAIPWPALSVDEGRGVARGEMLFPDRFGNMVTSIGVLNREGDAACLHPWIPGCPPLSIPSSRLRVSLPDARELPCVRTFAEVPANAPLAYIGSDGLLEIGINQGSATDSLKLARGTPVNLLWR